jgi:hypothetical protein
MKRQTKSLRHKGFALVVTLSLMILLTVVAVGLLTLSTISLRTVDRESAMAVAKGNARLALMLALGDLQKTTGQDRAITAPASLVDSNKPMGVTGVWTPWTRGSEGRSRTAQARDDNFRQWLVSTVDGQVPSNRGEVPVTQPGAQNSVTLLGDGSLGERATEKGDEQRISLPTTTVTNGRTKGRYAWAVIDEGTKARADLYEKDPDSKSANAMRVGAPPVDGVAALKGLDKLQPTENDSLRMVTIGNAGLVLGDDKAKLKVYNPDLTVHATSLLTDVVSGGLKKDLSLWFSKGLTSGERSSRLYETSGAISASNVSDPRLGLLESYHQYFKNIDKRVSPVIPAAGGVVAKIPSSYVASRADVASPNTPSEPIMVPTVVRVDMIFSLVSRDAHGSRKSGLVGINRPYMLHMLYLPVVTLHNPYDVPISLQGMKVTFRNVPIAFQFMVNGQPLTTGPVPLNQLYTNSDGNPAATKDFSCTLTSAVTGTAAPLVLKAGQTKLFGTPKVSPTWRWADEQAGTGSDGIALFDHRNDKTADFKMAPKLMTPATTGAGFDVDWLAPRSLQTAMGATVGGPLKEGIVSLAATDTVSVNYTPFAPTAGQGSFNVKVELQQNSAFREAANFSIKYGDASRLKTIVEQGTSARFPTARSFPETFPKSGADPAITWREIYEADNTPIKDYVKPKPFVIFSVGTRTTKESFVPTRTIADGNPVMNISNIDLSSGKDPIGGVPLEMVMMPIRNGNAAIEDIRDTEEGFAFGGSGSLYGSPRATFYEVPRAPLQSLAQFRNANLAGSGYMPMMTYTAGESRAHPQIGTEKITNTWTDRTAMLDHTWLSNESLWDRYFLSTIAEQTVSQFDSAKSYTEVMNDFFSLASRLPNQRFIPYTTESLGTPESVASSTSPEDVIAASIMLQGGFNVNSTSKDAWIAVLSSLREADIETQTGIEKGSKGITAFPRVRRPVGKNIDAQSISNRATNWEGYRSLSDETIEALAGEITTEIRKRGPFLSLADFVNRGVGSESDEINVKGALQAAIDHIPAINQVPSGDGIELSAGKVGSYGYQSTQAAVGNTATNAPGFLTQGDILTGLGSHITVRSDTFTIRAYGEARDVSGNNVTARAWCEAVVQRVPDYVDPNESATVAQTPIDPGAAGTANQVFGRRYQIVGFRWLSKDEV